MILFGHFGNMRQLDWHNPDFTADLIRRYQLLAFFHQEWIWWLHRYAIHIDMHLFLTVAAWQKSVKYQGNMATHYIHTGIKYISNILSLLHSVQIFPQNHCARAFFFKLLQQRYFFYISAVQYHNNPGFIFPNKLHIPASGFQLIPLLGNHSQFITLG